MTMIIRTNGTHTVVKESEADAIKEAQEIQSQTGAAVIIDSMLGDTVYWIDGNGTEHYYA